MDDKRMRRKGKRINGWRRRTQENGVKNNGGAGCKYSSDTKFKARKRVGGEEAR